MPHLMGNRGVYIRTGDNRLNTILTCQKNSFHDNFLADTFLHTFAFVFHKTTNFNIRTRSKDDLYAAE